MAEVFPNLIKILKWNLQELQQNSSVKNVEKTKLKQINVEFLPDSSLYS